MKSKIWKRVVLVTFATLLCGLTFCGYWAYKYYGIMSPEMPDDHYYETLEQRAVAAKKVAERHHLNENYCLFVDYGIPSGQPRLFVWSYKDHKVIASTYVMHGPGRGSTARTPVFSNMPGSNCSSLGRFVVTKQHGSKLKRSFRISGLDANNQTALVRGLMIHRSVWVDTHCWMDYIPLHGKSCQGCVTVSSKGMDYLENLIKTQDKKILLWSFCSKQNKA